MSVIERLLRRDASVDDSAVDTARADALEILPMRRRDLRRGVMKIEEQSYPRPWSQGVFESEIDQMKSGSRNYLVARRGRTVVGYAGLWFTAEEAHVTNVAVIPAAQRSGIATRLLLDQADQAIRRDCSAWTLEVRVSSTGAHDLYRRFGFVPAGIRKRYYENTEDAIVMWCESIQDSKYADLLSNIRGSLT